jgi:hypothetical protein
MQKRYHVQSDSLEGYGKRAVSYLAVVMRHQVMHESSKVYMGQSDFHPDSRRTRKYFLLITTAFVVVDGEVLQ